MVAESGNLIFEQIFASIKTEISRKEIYIPTKRLHWWQHQNQRLILWKEKMRLVNQESRSKVVALIKQNLYLWKTTFETAMNPWEPEEVWGAAEATSLAKEVETDGIIIKTILKTNQRIT